MRYVVACHDEVVGALIGYMFEVRDKPEMVERALLIRIYSDKREEDEAISLLEELRELVNTLGIGVIELCLVHTRSLHKKFLCGTGKAQ